MADIVDRDSANYAKRFVLFSYLDLRFCFACYPPESFKITCLTCICRNSSIQAFILCKTRDEMLRSTATSFVCLKGSLGKTQNSAGVGTKFAAIESNANFWEFFQRYPTTFSCKIAVRRSKYCLIFSFHIPFMSYFRSLPNKFNPRMTEQIQI